MSAINVILPGSLHKMAKEVATQDHISLNQFITSAISAGELEQSSMLHGMGLFSQ